jgi:Holliday junction resolvase
VELGYHFPTKEGELNNEFKKEDLLECVIHPSDNNPGCDLVIPESNAIFAIECKYSKPDSSTKLSKEDIKEKVNLIQKGFRPHFQIPQDKQLSGVVFFTVMS